MMLKSLSEYPEVDHRLLTADEERELSRKILAGNLGDLKPGDEPTEAQRAALEARNELVECNLRLVINVTMALTGRRWKVADLIQAGTIGLMTAADRYDADKFGTRFNTYAYYWINQAIVQEMQQDRLIRVPHHHLDELSRRNNERGCSKDYTYDHLLKYARAALCMNLADEVGDSPILEQLAVAPAEDDDAGEIRQQIDRALAVLNDRERYVISLLYGLNGERAMTYRECSKVIGVSHERCRQIDVAALRKLRKVMA